MHLGKYIICSALTYLHILEIAYHSMNTLMILRVLFQNYVSLRNTVLRSISRIIDLGKRE